MIKAEYDYLIIGGGPGGAAAGIGLRQQGKDCLIVERAALGRSKLCAGLVPQKTLRLLKKMLGDDAYAECMEAALLSQQPMFRIYDRHKCLLTGTPRDGIWTLDRPRFDRWMLQHYVQLGGELVTSNGVQSIDFQNNTVILQQGETVRYKQLIAADGANSRTAHQLDEQRGRRSHRKAINGFCLEANIPAKRLPNATGANLHFGIAPSSYAWSFRKAHTVCLGMIQLPSKHFDIQKAMLDFMTALGVESPETVEVRGAMLPYDGGRRQLCRDGILFVGDAAGLVEFPTGEGIYYALQSGCFAAEALSGDNADQRYATLCQPLCDQIHKSMRYQHTLEQRIPYSLFIGQVGKIVGPVTRFYENNIDADIV
ncbi:MAG: geranylgeranyl reductase family protein [Bacteroidales bacterium]|nr:geranylgeranyl reductase family protein [Bacteroidales bacterium]